MAEDNKLIPEAFLTIMGDPPLLAGEDPSGYKLLLGQLGAATAADGIVEWILVKDIADLTWQILRVRRWIAVILENGNKLGLAAGIDQLIDGHPGTMISSRAVRIAHDNYTDYKKDQSGQDGEGRAQRLLDDYGLEVDQIATANSFARNFETINNAEDLLTRLEYRRNRTLREIESRRRSFGAALRSASDGVIDAEADMLRTLRAIRPMHLRSLPMRLPPR